MQRKASVTVEAALLCPFLCLMLCGMILFTLRLYGEVHQYVEKIQDSPEQELPAAELIRLEVVIEDLTGGLYAE